MSLCHHWHGGQSTNLYAIASTGNLTLGTVRPTDCETDEEWYVNLWDGLDAELSRLVRQVSTNDPDNADLAVLDRFQRFASQTADRLRAEYELQED